MISAVLSIISLAEFTFLSSWLSWIAAVIPGLVTTVELILLASLPTILASEKAVTRLNTGITLIGYGIAFILPVIGGWFASNMDWIEMALVPSLIFCVVDLFAVERTQNYPKYDLKII